MGGRVAVGDPQRWWQGAALDSRRVAGGELFFALAGRREDGHAWIDHALERGAAGAVVARLPAPPRGTLIQVDDPYDGLHALTRAVRRQVPERLVAVTGSVGKTTTKELLALCLGRRYRVAASPGNLNNLYGFPLALLGIPDGTQWMVAEMGMSTPGELGAIARLGEPDAVVLTGVRPAHLEGLGSLEAVAEAKAEILAGLRPGGLLVANADDPWVVRIAARWEGPVRWFGRGATAAVRAVDVTADPRGPGSRFRLVAPEGEAAVTLPLHGLYNVDNALAAAACATACGVPVVEAAAALAEARPLRGRGELRTLPRGITLVDDSYNASPDAVERALEGAAALSGHRRWAVLGEMLELGDAAAAYHREAGVRAAALGFSPVVAVGEGARPLAEAARQAGAEAVWLASAEEAAAWAAQRLAAGDVVLVKGSRGIGLEAVVEALIRAGGEG